MREKIACRNFYFLCLALAFVYVIWCTEMNNFARFANGLRSVLADGLYGFIAS